MAAGANSSLVLITESQLYIVYTLLYYMWEKVEVG